mmetsp:Transcript_12673/g.29234  ORF Transcript_12673/g.29234 Transcript_12673/m.29234 type:complete len:257 (+) Transcript_12673:1400-2170(+)
MIVTIAINERCSYRPARKRHPVSWSVVVAEKIRPWGFRNHHRRAMCFPFLSSCFACLVWLHSCCCCCCCCGCPSSTPRTTTPTTRRHRRSGFASAWQPPRRNPPRRKNSRCRVSCSSTCARWPWSFPTRTTRTASSFPWCWYRSPGSCFSSATATPGSCCACPCCGCCRCFRRRGGTIVSVGTAASATTTSCCCCCCWCSRPSRWWTTRSSSCGGISWSSGSGGPFAALVVAALVAAAAASVAVVPIRRGRGASGG